MNIFEYLSIAYSLVFSFAAVQLVAGLPHAIAATRRYSVHISHVFLVRIGKLRGVLAAGNGRYDKLSPVAALRPERGGKEAPNGTRSSASSVVTPIGGCRR